MDREQPFLLPPSMTDWLPEDHLVWFVIETVGALDTTAFHARARLGGVGRAGYDPDMLLTLWVYAMAHGTRSSRQIERLCHTDVAFRIICAQDVPDHTVLARFRQDHERALADLLTATLRLAARLGMVRLGVVAFDGTKIAASAAMAANRTEDGLRKLAERYLADAAGADTAEDELFGEARGDEPPAELRDRTRRRERIRQALDEIATRQAAERDRQRANRNAAARYERALADPNAQVMGSPPKAVDPVAAAKARWQRERRRVARRVDAWQTRVGQIIAAGGVPRGRRPVPADAHCRVKAAWAAYQQARAAAAQAGQPATTAPDSTTGTDAPRANLTDPASRLLKTHNGWIQGYNCQTATSEDQFIIHAEATQDANDVHQFHPTATAVTALAADLATHTGRDDLTVGTMIGDAGYDSDTNLTAHGPDRLIPNTNRHTINDRAATDPATGDPPDQATARQRMDHRLRTTEGHQLYKRRAPLAEAPNAWLKDGRGLRQFARRGLAAARSELRFAAAVTNLLRLRALGVTTAHLATT